MAMTESVDAPMMDFSGEDIPMQTSSSTSWIHPEAAMDDDSNFNLDDVEIDMNYHPEPFEYEMLDDTTAEQLVEVQVHDVEVIDVSQAHTPALIDTVVEDATTASPAVPEHDLTDTHRSTLGSPPTLTIQVPSPTPHPTPGQEDHGGAEAGTIEQSEWDQGHSELPAAPSSPHLIEHVEALADPVNVEGTAEPTLTWDAGSDAEYQAHLRQRTPTSAEKTPLESTHEGPSNDLGDRWSVGENPVPSHASSGDPHEVSDGIFIDPPPPVIMYMGDSEEECYLFNRPTHRSPAANDGGSTDKTLFLHDLPTLYYEPLTKVFHALRSESRLVRLFDLSRGELVIDACDLVDLVISEDNSYTNEVSFHDLNLLHDHADLAGPLRIRVGCNPRRFIARYRELKSKLEQFSLLDETGADDVQLRTHYGLAEQVGVRDDSDDLARYEEGNEDSSPEEPKQAASEQTDGADTAVHTVGRSDEGEPSNDTGPEQAQPTADDSSTKGTLSGNECPGQLVGTVEDEEEEGTVGVTGSEAGYSGLAEDPDPAAVHEQPGDHDIFPLGENPTEHEEAVATTEDYKISHHENDDDSEHEENVVIEGNTKGVDWGTAASNMRQPQDDSEHHDQDDAEGTYEHSALVDLTTTNADDNRITAEQDTDTDSIGQRTLDEFADAQDVVQDVLNPREEGEESNSATDQSNELNPDLDQFGDDFNWEEDFGGDFEGEFGEFEDQNNFEAKRISSQEPASGGSSKRGFDQVDSDTAEEEETPSDVSPNSKRKKVL